MPEEEDIFDLYPSGLKLLDQMRSRSMDTDDWSHMLRTAFDEKDVRALNKVIGHLQNALAANTAGPAAAVPSPPVHDVPAPAPRANSAPPMDPEIPPPPKRRRRGGKSVAESSHGPDGEPQEAFLEIFTKFAFEYGREQFKRNGNVHLISNDMIFAAFRASDPSYAEQPQIPCSFFIPKYLSYYFSRGAWLEAVQKGDASLFHAQRQLTPVQQAKTITEKLRFRPDIRPCIDWCVEWLRSQPSSKQKSKKLADAYETARKLAVKEADELHANPRSPFHIKWESVRAGCFIPFQMLLKYAVSGDDGMEHTEGEAELVFESDSLDCFEGGLWPAAAAAAAPDAAAAAAASTTAIESPAMHGGS